MPTPSSQPLSVTIALMRDKAGASGGAQDTSSQTTPMDDLISQVDSYIKNPKLVTPDTLNDLKSKLIDLKPVVDGDDSQSSQTPQQQPQGGTQ